MNDRARQLSDYNHITLAADALAAEIGIVETGFEDFSRHMREFCHVVRGEDGVPVIVHKESGKSMKDFALTDYRRIKPQQFPQDAPFSAIEASFGANPNLTARGQLRNAVGETEYRNLAKKWGSDPVKLVPGRPPGEAPAEAPKQRSNNPWSNSVENLDQHGRYSAKAIGRQASIAAGVGPQAAAAMAKAAGSFLGATRPNSKPLLPRKAS